MKRYILLLIIVLATTWVGVGQSKTERIMFYNVENLFHPSNDSLKADDELTPEGMYHWSYKKYYRKVSNIAKVIIALGEGNPPIIIGLAEIENEQVLKDLCYRSPLQKFGYRYLHHESPDRRGVDVALLYRDSSVTVLRERAVPILFPFSPESQNRDLLYTCLQLHGGDSLHVVVNHWTSRYGGYAATIPKRNYYANIARNLVDSILADEPNAQIFLMGDFNDYPTDESLMLHLRGQRYCADNQNDTLFNLMLPFLDQNNVGSHKHDDFWGCLDQIIVSRALLFGSSAWQICKQKAHIFQADFLLVPDEKYGGFKNYRTFLGPRYIGGFSDHLPVFVELEYAKPPH